LAALGDHFSIVEYLVNQKADLNSKNNYGQTPLVLARSNVMEFLKSKGGQ